MKRLLTFLLLIAGCEPPLYAAPPEPWLEVRDVRVIDGDTIAGDIVLPLGVVLDNEVIRASDYDAWESRRGRQSVTITDGEVKLGKQAKEALTQLVRESEGVWLVPLKHRDAYGRRLGRLYVLVGNGMTPLSDWATENHYTRPAELKAMYDLPE